MEMHQLRYFLAICETLNFTRSAETCHVTQPALTRLREHRRWNGSDQWDTASSSWCFQS